MSYKWLIDAGHGGVKDGVYQCLAKGKMYEHPGFTIYEGVINRLIAIRLGHKLKQHGIEYEFIHHDIEDWSLTKRVNKVNNSIARSSHKCILLSIHSNAGKGIGFEIFTSPGQTKSDKVADIFAKQYIKDFPQYRFRADKSDGDYDKEEAFTMLTKTKCPAILVENLFFDEINQAKYLLSNLGQERIAQTLFTSIVEVNKIIL